MGSPLPSKMLSLSLVFKSSVQYDAISDRHKMPQWSPSPHSLCWLDSSDLLPMNRTGQKWWVLLPLLGLQKTVASVLLADLFLSVLFLWWSQLLERPMWQETEDDLWLIASKALDPANSLWVPATAEWTGSRSHPLEPWKRLGPSKCLDGGLMRDPGRGP